MLIKGFSINLNRCTYPLVLHLCLPELFITLFWWSLRFLLFVWKSLLYHLLHRTEHWQWSCYCKESGHSGDVCVCIFCVNKSSNLNGIENFFLLKLQNVAQYDAVCTDNVCRVQMSCVRKFRRQLHHAATLAVLTWTQWLQMFVAILSFVVVTAIGRGTMRYVGSAAKSWLWTFSDTVTNN